MKSELQQHKKCDRVKWIFTGIAFIFVFTLLAGLILQVFGSGKAKPSEWFKQEQKETANFSAQGEGSETKMTADRSIRAFASTYAEAVTPPCEHLTETVVNSLLDTGRGDKDLSLNTATQQMTFTVRSRDAGSVFSESNLCFAEYTGSSINYYFTTAIWCFHGIKNYYVNRYGFSFSDFEIDWDDPALSSGWDKIANKPVLQESYDPLTDTLRLEIKCKFYYMQNNPEPHCHFSPTSVSFTARKKLALPPDPVKEGHTFAGWFYDSEFTSSYAGEAIYENTRLYAKFEINTFTVSFDPDGGSAVESQTVNWNTAANLSTPTKEKHAFKGWFLPDGTQYTDQPVKADTVLTAQWERNVFTVTFETNGGSAVASKEVNLNAPVMLPTTEKTGNDFKCWLLPDGTEYTDQGITQDITLTARWQIKTFTVTFMVDGVVYDTMTVEYGTKLVQVTQSAEPKLFALYTLNAKGESLANDYAIDGDVTVHAEKGSTAQQVQGNWKKIVIGGVCGAVMLAFLCCIPSIVKNRKRRG